MSDNYIEVRISDGTTYRVDLSYLTKSGRNLRIYSPEVLDDMVKQIQENNFEIPKIKLSNESVSCELLSE